MTWALKTERKLEFGYHRFWHLEAESSETHMCQQAITSCSQQTVKQRQWALEQLDEVSSL